LTKAEASHCLLNKPQEAKSLRNPGFDGGAGDGPIVGHAPDLTASFLLDKRENCGVKPGVDWAVATS